MNKDVEDRMDVYMETIIAALVDLAGGKKMVQKNEYFHYDEGRRDAQGVLTSKTTNYKLVDIK